MKERLKGSAKICLMISAGVMLLALILSLAGLGINYGLDFSGGLSIKYQMNSAFDQADVEAALRGQGIAEYQISKAGTAQTELQLRIREISDEGVQVLRTGLETALKEKYPQMDAQNAEVGYVGPVAGRTLLENAIFSVLLASVLMLGYIAIRFDFNSGVAAIVGLIHDVLIMLSFMVLFRSFIQMNSSFIAAMLTIVGYSINNTIVIFDRIRENVKLANFNAVSRAALVTTSVKQCLGRTINTSLTTLITIVALYIMGVNAIKEFALPIIVGLLSGLYSANLINGYLWAMMEAIRPHKKVKAKKA